jgi:ubiquinone/menaquinone biosynthesis C-methylase UbiE
MIAHATETAAAEGVPADRVRFDVADVADLPHESGSVDLVVSSLSLHHWEDRASGLREIARVLRPGGRAWIYDIRWVLRRTAADARRAAPGSYLEPRLAGARWFNPLGRLVLAPADPGTAPM